MYRHHASGRKNTELVVSVGDELLLLDNVIWQIEAFCVLELRLGGALELEMRVGPEHYLAT